MTKVLNFFGGPGVGKSTVASGVFHELKKRDISCEYVSEYAKDCVWEELNKLLENQVHVFSEQLRRQWRLIDKVKYIITDSPLLLSGIYYRYYTDQAGRQKFFSKHHTDLAIKFFDATFHEFDNRNYIIRRQKKYNPYGRIQSEEEAKILDKVITEKMDKENISYSVVNYEDAVRYAVMHIETELNYVDKSGSIVYSHSQL